LEEPAMLVTGSRLNTSTSFSSFQALLKLTCGTTVKAKEISLKFSITFDGSHFLPGELWLFSMKPQFPIIAIFTIQTALHASLASTKKAPTRK
jgi:hypothetical protein